MSSITGNDDAPAPPQTGEAQGGAVAAEEDERQKKLEILEKKLWGKEDWVHPVTQNCPGGPGLVNLGNTCYINSVVHILANCPDLLNQFMKGRYKGRQLERAMKGELNSHLSMTHQLIDLIYVMWFYQRPIKPGGFVSAVRKFAIEQGMDEFGGQDQGDASEFMNFMLDMLDTCLNAKVEDEDANTGNVRTRSQKIKDEFVRTHNGSLSEIANMFHIMTCMNIRDLEGRDESLRYQQESAIHLQLPDDDHARVTLKELMDEHFKEERMEGDCKWFSEKIGEKVDAIKVDRIVYLPKYLTIVLKRFNQGGPKKNVHVDFPVEETLDIAPWQFGTEKTTTYRYIGSINHLGVSMAGHQVTSLRQGENQIEVNDRAVMRTDPSMICSPMSYVIVYEKTENIA